MNYQTYHFYKMKKIIEARHNAHMQVKLTLKNNEPKFAGIPALINASTKLESLVNKTSSLLTKVESIPSKTGGNKKMRRTKLIAVSLKVSNILKAYAFVAKDKNLSNFLITSQSVLATHVSHQGLLDYSKGLTERIAPITSKLADYGLTSEIQDSLATEINNFGAIITEPRRLINERKTNNKLIKDLLKEIYYLLNNRIDPLMELFVEDKEFYLSYKSARMIVDPATRSKNNNEQVGV